MKSLWWLVAGLGAAAGLAQFATWRRTRAAGLGLDLNACSREELLGLPGMNEDLAERVLDNRPYRSKFDLLNRRIIPSWMYRQLGSRLRVSEAASHQVVVAS